MPINPQFAVIIDAYEGNGHLDLSRATERIDGVIAQVSRGLYIDKEFRRTHDTCGSAATPFSAYNQYVAQLNSRRLDPIRQADIVLEHCLGLNVRGLWWAYDSAGLNQGKLNKSTAIDTLDALLYLKQQSPLLVGVYGNPSDISQLYRDAPMVKSFPLWLARYSINQTQWSNTQNMLPSILLPHIDFLDGLPWVMWQYASEANWLGHDTGKSYGLESYSVDINCWLGDAATMRAMLGVVTPAPVDWKQLFNDYRIRVRH